MKSEIIDIKNAKKESFPALYRSKNSELIVMMHANKCGVVVANHCKIGYYADDWVMCQFERMTGDVTIKFSMD